ncbi:hypothetical protein [Roseovarius arcticus]|uniref:hypothetical protein n=1 Tax=Roseovarius arcticus TaxID=2547404 RepID=UPI001110F0F6|nr:hypothetical protein [Roseovarius arcticus]
MSRPAPKVAILPQDLRLGMRPGAIPLDQLLWPLGQPSGIKGRTLSDLEAHDHLIVFPRRSMHWRPGFGTQARVSIMVMEPGAIHSGHLKALRRSYKRFYKVLAHNDELLSAIPNGAFLPFGSTWVTDWRTLDTQKTRMISLIASNKRSQVGHRLRHRIVEWAAGAGVDMDVMGRGYTPFTTKSDGLAPYRYSVVIENVREPNYFSEKLLDAVLCRTVPIYWGCPNIDDFLDTSGMIVCQSEKDIRAAILTTSAEDYETRVPALDAIQEKAAEYGDFYGRAARAVLQT